MSKMTDKNNGFFLSKVSVCFILFYLSAAALNAAQIADDAGRTIDFAGPPQKVVSIVPAVTEIICALGAEKNLIGVTYHDTHLPGIVGLPVVGGAFTPQFSIINGLSPDLLIVAPRDLEKAEKGRAGHSYQILVWNDGHSLKEAEQGIKRLGALFQKQDEAVKIIESNLDLMSTIERKISLIPISQKKRTMRLLFNNGRLMTPEKNSFQTEMIKAAGGITPEFDGSSFVPVDLKMWREFNPEVVFDCGPDRAALLEFINSEGWNDVDAVKNRRIYNFPCALTCRASANTGYFVAWLASMIYADEFSETENLVHPQKILSERAVEIDLPYIKKASIVDTRIMDFVHRTLMIDFKSPQTIVSSDGGERHNISLVGNSFSPTPTWSIYHKAGFEKSRDDLFSALKLKPDQAEIIFTGADMNNLAVKATSFKDMSVTALVTAGVEGNALRTSKDSGNWYEPGTINIIVMTNHKLSPRAAARALITITEAKTAALWDMDVRSVQSALKHPATGTGTDSIIVVSGEGALINGTGGHTKMGELIAEAVYGAVQEALLKQNGKARVRHIFERLAERGLSPHNLMAGPDCPCLGETGNFQADLEELLLAPRYQGFLEAAFSLSDARIMGQISDSSAFDDWALEVASEIAGRPVEKIENIVGRDDLPPILKTALDGLGTGLKHRSKGEDK